MQRTNSFYQQNHCLLPSVVSDVSPWGKEVHNMDFLEFEVTLEYKGHNWFQAFSEGRNQLAFSITI
jgi:hypothetical protein